PQSRRNLAQRRLSYAETIRCGLRSQSRHQALSLRGLDLNPSPKLAFGWQMVLWIGFAVLTAAVIMFITRPLFGANVRAADTREADLAVYRDQLAEIEADRARGLIEAADADSARAELGRRILAIGARHESDLRPETTGVRPPFRVSIAAAAFISLASVAVYISLGPPGVPGQPHSVRLSAPRQDATVGELIGRVEAELRANPEDGRGWDVLAPVYLRLNRFSEAADAYGHAIRLLGESVDRL